MTKVEARTGQKYFKSEAITRASSSSTIELVSTAHSPARRVEKFSSFRQSYRNLFRTMFAGLDASAVLQN